jgi:hypothetical protein
MKQRLFRFASRVALCAALILCCLATTKRVVYSWDDSDFFAAEGACDDNSYFGTLDSCRNQAGYPTDPSESDCRYQAASAYDTCLTGIPSPSYGLDFCSQARGRRDMCASLFGSNSQNPDLQAWGECYDASQVDRCE